MRNIVGASEEHGVIAVAHHPQVGDAIGLVLRNAERAREDLKATLEEMDRKPSRPPRSDLLRLRFARFGPIQYAGPRQRLYPAVSRTDTDRRIFSGFEIGPLADRTGLLQYSGVLALVSEKRSS